MTLAPKILVALATGLTASTAVAGNPTHPILFVTQVPMPSEVNSRTVSASYQSCVSAFGNHLADTAHAGRGGSLLERFSDGQVVDLLAVADWSAIAGGKPAANTVAVRNPSVNWTANKAIFSMVIGAPSGPADTTPFLWQLYELSLPTQAQLNAGMAPLITKVLNQPLYNNVFPTYALGGKIVFSSDRPYNGQAHLLQREEYLSLLTVSGLWSLDPTDASSLQLLHHSPSGAFSPSVDSAGRVVFANWDHLARDPEAVTDSRKAVTAAPYNETFAQTFNGSGNFADETPGAAFTPVTSMAPETWDIFPEPRNFDRKTLIDVYGSTINGMALNIFMPWMINLDGTGGEMLNHVGRQELAPQVDRSYTKDPGLVDLSATSNPGYGGMAARTYFNNFMWPREDPLNPGVFYGSDGSDIGTHGAGQIVKLNNAGTTANGTPRNPDGITVTYVTSGSNGKAKPALLTSSPVSAANAESLYRTPVPLADGNLVASHASGVTRTDANAGTASQPASYYTFRLRSLKPSGSTFIPDVTLTAGIPLNTSYYVGSTLVTYNGMAWELDPAEVVARPVPTAAAPAGVDPIEAGVFASVGVDVPTFQNYLRSLNAALTVGRNVTKRDMHDRQQPYNLKVAWSNTQTNANSGTLYSVAWMQFLQGDLRRGYLSGGSTALPGRRVIATPLRDTWSENVQTAGAPAGSVKLGDDGSFAAIIPARKAMTWQLRDDDAAKTSQVRERIWVTFQPGEIRTCSSCHGINTSDQTGMVSNPVGPPTNAPQALASLLQFWKTNHPPGAVQYTAASVSTAKNAGNVALSVSRTGGSTGPVSVSFATTNGSALAGTDYTATNGLLSWLDGDTAAKTIIVPILNNPPGGAPKTFSVTLSSPRFGTLGTTSSETVTLN